MIRVSTLAASITLAGCATVGPDYQPAPLPNVSLENQQQLEISDRQIDWWQHFNDPQLSHVIGKALSHNNSLTVAEANMRRAFARFRDSNDEQFDGNWVTNYEVLKQLDSSGSRQLSRQYQAGAALTWRADLFGKLERASDAAFAEAGVAMYAWQDFQVELIAQLVRGYAELKGAQRSIGVQQRHIDSLSRTRDLVKTRVDNGFASDLDFYRIEAQLKGVEARIPALLAQQERSRQTLIALIGGQDASGGIDWQESEFPTLNAPLALGDTHLLLRARPDVAMAERRLAAATANIGVNTADLYPDISVTGFLGFFSGSISSLTDNSAWSVAPGLNWNLFNLDSVKARIAAANADQQIALAQFEQQIIDAIAEAETALSDYRQQRLQRNLLQQQFDASAKALQLAKTHYDAGAIDLLDLLDSERTMLQAQDALVALETSNLQAIAEIYRAFGGRLQGPTSLARLASDTPFTLAPID